MKIEDGSGKGFKAKVDSNNRIFVTSISKDQSDYHSETGDKYNIATGDVTLTSCSESAIFYIKNNENKDLVITSLTYNLGNAVDACCANIANKDIKVDVYRNPTAGTLVSGASAVSINKNLNFSSSKVLSVNAFKGSQGSTLTDGALSVSSRFSGPGRQFLEIGHIVLPKGSSIGVKVTPPAANASMVVSIAASVFLQTLDL